MSEISDYIKNELERGFPLKKIKKALIEIGHDPALVKREVTAFEKEEKRIGIRREPVLIETEEVSKPSKKYKPILISLMVLIVIFSGYLFYLNLPEKVETIKCPALNEISSLEQIDDLLLYDYAENGVSYFECSKDKGKITDVCLKEHDVNSCSLKLATFYTMYLYKTKKMDNLEPLIMLANLAVREGLTEASIEEGLKNLMDANHKSIDEMNLMKGIDVEMAFEDPANERKIRYFNNILKFRDASIPEDCNGIYANESDPNEDSINRAQLLRDICKLSFVSNMNNYCEELIRKEIQACETQI